MGCFVITLPDSNRLTNMCKPMIYIQQTIYLNAKFRKKRSIETVFEKKPRHWTSICCGETGFQIFLFFIQVSILGLSNFLPWLVNQGVNSMKDLFYGANFEM